MKILCNTLPPSSFTGGAQYVNSGSIARAVKNNIIYVAERAFAGNDTKCYNSCCRKSICNGCIYSFCKSGNHAICPFCKAKTVVRENKKIEEIMKRVEANDDGAMVMLASCYHVGCEDLQQDRAKAMELFVRAVELVSSMAHFTLGSIYREGGI